MRLLLIRHGQTRLNREQIFRGGTDVPLDAAGRRQAQAVGRLLLPARLDVVYSGPLQRARQTAEYVAAPHRLPVVIEPGLDDMRFGQWEGKSLAEVERAHPVQYRQWQTRPWDLTIPGGTTLRQIESCSWGTVKAVVGRHRAMDTIVFVTHRVVLKLRVLKMLGIGIRGFWRIALDPCSLTVVECDNGRFVLERLNDTCHLRKKSGGAADF
jgi:broad specificity phosphatase PhoE